MKEKILRVTAKLISKNGINSTSTRAICTELGISAPTLYYHFSDKAILLDAVMNLSFEKHLAKICLSAKNLDVIEELKESWNAYMNFVIEEPDLYSIMIDSILKGDVPRSGIYCLKDLITKFKSPELEDRLIHDAEKSASIYLASAQGVAIMSMAQKKKDLHQETRDTILCALISNFKSKERK